MDDYFNQQYEKEQQFGAIFGLFAGLAIFIACLGLIGLTSFTTLQRTKEIGIRKILGASIAQILSLLTKDFIKLVLIAGLIAIPLAYWFLQKWLNSYAYVLALEIWYFLIPLIVIALLTLLTIGGQSIKTALANPVEALRNE